METTPKKTTKQDDIKAMLLEGKSVKEIAEAMKTNIAYVHKIKRDNAEPKEKKAKTEKVAKVKKPIVEKTEVETAKPKHKDPVIYPLKRKPVVKTEAK